MSGASYRPTSLVDVAERTASGGQSFDPALREFLDHFYSNAGSRPEALAGRPPRLDPLKDAYLAAVAEHLAHLYGFQPPDWTEDQGWDLKRPFFAGGLESLKAILTVESPTAFRRRLIFVSHDALSRPARSES